MSSLRDEVLDSIRGRRRENHPSYEAASKAAADTAARGVVEAFSAREQGRQPNYGEAALRNAKGGRVEFAFEQGNRRLDISEVDYDERGLIKVMCKCTVDGVNQALNLPIYVYNPVVTVEDPDGDIMVDDGEGGTIFYREDPVEALAANILRALDNE